MSLALFFISLRLNNMGSYVVLLVLTFGLLALQGLSIASNGAGAQHLPQLPSIPPSFYSPPSKSNEHVFVRAHSSHVIYLADKSYDRRSDTFTIMESIAIRSGLSD